MTTIEILLAVWAAGLRLEHRGNQILVCGLKPTASPELLAMLREHKPALLAVLTDQSQKETI